jgi:hypothetical protein
VGFFFSELAGVRAGGRYLADHPAPEPDDPDALDLPAVAE